MKLYNCDDLVLSQCRIQIAKVNQTLIVLIAAKIMHRFSHFPTTQCEIKEKQVAFMQIDSFSGVVRVLDGTHIKVAAQSTDEDAHAG